MKLYFGRNEKNQSCSKISCRKHASMQKAYNTARSVKTSKSLSASEDITLDPKNHKWIRVREDIKESSCDENDVMIINGLRSSFLGIQEVGAKLYDSIDKLLIFNVENTPREI